MKEQSAEALRVQDVQQYLNLSFSKENELEDIVKLASEICDTPVALLTLIDDDTQWLRWRVGTDVEQTPRAISFCTHAIQQEGIMIVPDMIKDERFVQNPLVTDDPKIRFYAGSPLINQNGSKLGTLCVLDVKPNELSDKQQEYLDILSRQIMNILDLELNINRLNEVVLQTKAQKQKLRSFFDSSLYAHLLIDKDFNIVAYNKALADFVLQLLNKQVKAGVDIRQIISESYRNTFIENIEKSLTGKRIYSETPIEYENAGKIWWRISYEPACDTEDNIIGVSVNAADITERKQYEEKILKQNAVLRKVADIHSHEFRGPVASILGLMDIIKSEGLNGDNKHLQYLEAAAKELDEKIHDANNSIEEVDKD